MTIRSFALFGLLALLACAKPVQAAQSYDNCAGFITTLPAIISAQGTWCLKQDLATPITSGSAITINANNVTLDCNDFKLGGLAAGINTQTVGIYANNRLNTTVRHCNVRGFYYGIQLDGAGSGGNAVEDNRLDGNTYIGIWVIGDGSVIQRNRLFDTGVSFWQASPIAIYSGFSVDVLDNTISGVLASPSTNGYAYGMFVASSNVSGNRVSGVLADGTGVATAISMNINAHFFVTGNFLIGDGTTGSKGLACINPGEGRAKDNVITGFDVGYFNCGDAGGNDVSL